jgi:Cupin-like domain
MNLRPVEVVENISREGFRRLYLLPKKPVILKGIAETWPAYHKWKLPYFKQMAAAVQVPLYDNSKPSPTSMLNVPDKVMRFGDYLDMIDGPEPVALRMFLFNAFDHIPSLCDDFTYPEHLMKGFLKKYPMLFFGGASSIVYLHYDMDLSNVFLTQFHGKKRVLLFDQQYSGHLYRLPLTVQSYVDIETPDYARYPALRYLEGYETVMEHGDMLFIPAEMWHYMNYLEGGYALALRAFDPSVYTRLKGIANLTVMRKFDDAMKKRFGAKWHNYKTEKAYKLADELVRNAQTQRQPIEF